MPRKFVRDPKTVERRKRVKERLENQLLTGLKFVKYESGAMGNEDLNEKDRARIDKELEILKTRI